MREVQSEIESFHAMLDASVIAGQLGDVRKSEGDQFLLYMRNLPNKVQETIIVDKDTQLAQWGWVGFCDQCKPRASCKT